MMEEKLIMTIADILGIDADDLDMDTMVEDVEEWDSLAMVEVIGEIEAEFDCSIPFAEVESIKCVNDFMKYLA